MTREQAIYQLMGLMPSKEKIVNSWTKEHLEALSMAIRALEGNLWHKASEELPPVDTEVVCKMKGVPHTEHFICKWDGKYWWHWSYFGQGIQGWFGLNTGWEVVERVRNQEQGHHHRERNYPQNLVALGVR